MHLDGCHGRLVGVGPLDRVHPLGVLGRLCLPEHGEEVGEVDDASVGQPEPLHEPVVLSAAEGPAKDRDQDTEKAIPIMKENYNLRFHFLLLYFFMQISQVIQISR